MEKREKMTEIEKASGARCVFHVRYVRRESTRKETAKTSSDIKDKVKNLYLLLLKYERALPLFVLEQLSKDERAMLELQPKGSNKESGARGEWHLKPSFRSLIKVVATGGVFDGIHLGHIKTLQAASKQGDVLVVFVARDTHIKAKGRVPLHTQEERAELLSSLCVVDAVVLGKDDKAKCIGLVKPDVVVFGYDQKPFPIEGVKNVEIIKLNEAFEPSRLKSTKLIDNESHKL